MDGILAEAWELVEKKLLSEEDFREFVCVNPIRFYTHGNPDFFAGTRCEDAARRIVTEDP